jgi:uncharacterized membrane protein YecN with MAPEG domain
MQAYYGVALVTIAASLVYFVMATRVARAHVKTGILPPAMTGDPFLERTVRAHTNTLEWMPIFLPSMWLFAIYWSPSWAAGLGVVWIVGRIIYFVGYRSAAQKRLPGFFIQALAASALVLGAAGRIIYLMVFSAA